MTQTIMELALLWKESAHRLRTAFYFADGEGAFEVRHSFLYFFSLVRIFRVQFCTQIPRPLAYGVRICSKDSAIADVHS